MPAEAARDSAGEEGGEHRAEQNGDTPDELSEPDTSTMPPECLPDSWETMAEVAGGHKSVHEAAGGIPRLFQAKIAKRASASHMTGLGHDR